RDLAVAKMREAQADAAHVQALEAQRIETFADDEFGAATTDVNDQAPPRVVRNRIGDAQVDEARLLDTGNDFDRVAERLAGALEEDLLAMRLAQRVGADDAHVLGVHVAQPLPETLQAFEGARGHGLVEPVLRIEAGGKAHHFTQAIEDGELAVRITR